MGFHDVERRKSIGSLLLLPSGCATLRHVLSSKLRRFIDPRTILPQNEHVQTTYIAILVNGHIFTGFSQQYHSRYPRQNTTWKCLHFLELQYYELKNIEISRKNSRYFVGEKKTAIDKAPRRPLLALPYTPVIAK